MSCGTIYKTQNSTKRSKRSNSFSAMLSIVHEVSELSSKSLLHFSLNCHKHLNMTDAEFSKAMDASSTIPFMISCYKQGCRHMKQERKKREA